MSRDGDLIIAARINPEAVSYHVLRSSLAVVATIIFIPFIVVWVPLALWYYKRWHSRLEVALHDRVVRINQGILFRVEKSIPLDQITDIALVQGPLMRRMGLHGMRVETAGQTGTAGQALASVIGVVDTPHFRDAVLAQQAVVRGHRSEEGPKAAGQEALLRDMLNTLKRIEKAIKAQ